jgi:Arylsulfatase A and related enzymes
MGNPSTAVQACEMGDATADEKKLFARQAEVFAAYVAYTDYEIGRVIQAVKDLGKLDNTLIIFISGDNGTSAEGTTVGTPFDQAALEAIDIPVADQLKYYDVWGSDKTQPHMAVAWAWAFDTPFKWTKQIASHFGGTRQGMAISWPGHINDLAASARSSTTNRHRTDHPRSDGHRGTEDGQRHRAEADRRREHGVHLRQNERQRPVTRTTQYFEMFGNRAIYHDGWIAPPRRRGLG